MPRFRWVPLVARILSVALIPGLAFAQHRDDEEIVVTATALRESPLEVAQPVSVLGGRDLRQAPGGSLGESVSRTPGVTGSYFGAAASRPVIRGQSGDRVLMLEDGADALDASALSADHAVSIEGFGADQVEILKGPATLLYGNGAVGGLVNVITHRVPVAAVDEFGGAAELRGDTALAERSVALRFDTGLPLGAEQGLAFHFDGFDRQRGNLVIPGLALTPRLRTQLAAEGIADNTRDRLPNSASTARGGALGVSWVGSRGFLGAALSHFATLYGIPGPDEAAVPGTPAAQWLVEDGPAIDLAQTRLDWRGEWRPETGPFLALRLRGASNRYRHVELSPDGAVGTRFDNAAHDFRVLADHEHGEWRGTAGVQWRDVDLSVVGEEAFVPPSRTRNLAAFAFEEIGLGTGTLELGARLEQQALSVAGTRRNETAIGLAAGWVWRWTDELHWSLQLTRSQRLPGATELHADGPHAAMGRYEIGDVALGRETARTIDLSLRGRDADLATTWSIGVFAQDFRDYFYLESLGRSIDGLPAFRYRQGDARFTGLEAEARWRLQAGDAATGAARWELRLAGDWMRGTLRTGGPLPQMPPGRLMAGLSRGTGPWNASLDLYWTAAQGRVAAGEPPTGSGLAVDFAVDWGGEWHGMPVSAFMKANNLLDRDLRRHVSPLKEYVPLPGRGVAAGLRLWF